MKRATVFLRFTFALIVCLGFMTTVSPASAGGNRCTDRCADRYNYRKRACKAIPFKHERKICERRAKEAKEDCKRRCR